ncbi:MAG: dihydrodipicolinate synthase family protein [Candidatus Thorarchaeota archaeon]|nr:dihydrodipicolinate synthase family protein [Candidatus Thorarchaeota archaeon]
MHRGDTVDFEKFREILQGYSVTTATPFSTDLTQIDTNGLSENIDFLVMNKVPLIIPNGNTGEFYSLSEEEWLQVLKTAVNASDQKTNVMSGIGHSTKTALSQIEKVKSLGVPAVMIMYPQHVFASEEGILDYYRTLLDSSKGISVVLYKKGSLLSDSVLSKLLVYDNLVGVKYAFGRIVDFSQSVQKIGHKIIWSCGTAERFAPFFFLAGARAFTSGLGNFAPNVTKQMYDALKNGDYSSAMKIQEMISPLEFLREGHASANNVPVVKTAMDYIGLKGGISRPPIHQLTDSERRLVIDAIKDWNLKTFT